MQEIKIVNYINIAGEVMLWDDLPEEKKKKIAEELQVRMMTSAGYVKVSA